MQSVRLWYSVKSSAHRFEKDNLPRDNELNAVIWMYIVRVWRHVINIYSIEICNVSYILYATAYNNVLSIMFGLVYILAWTINCAQYLPFRRTHTHTYKGLINDYSQFHNGQIMHCVLCINCNQSSEMSLVNFVTRNSTEINQTMVGYKLVQQIFSQFR